jgi:hypothetical protein
VAGKLGGLWKSAAFRTEATVDVHAPHHPIMSWKEFLVHLLAITIGLLIAVGIEGLVELLREHTLVKEARQTLREEIQFNSDRMADALPEIETEKTSVANSIKFLTRIVERPKDKAAQTGSISANYSLIGLHDTAWRTAQATNALAYMPYAEAQRYSDIYGSQKDFTDQENKLVEDEAQLLGVFAKTDFGHGDVTPETAGLALERYGVWRGHLIYLSLMAHVTAASDKAFLEGKEAPTTMSEQMTNK